MSKNRIASSKIQNYRNSRLHRVETNDVDRLGSRRIQKLCEKGSKSQQNHRLQEYTNSNIVMLPIQERPSKELSNSQIKIQENRLNTVLSKYELYLKKFKQVEAINSTERKPRNIQGLIQGNFRSISTHSNFRVDKKKSNPHLIVTGQQRLNEVRMNPQLPYTKRHKSTKNRKTGQKSVSKFLKHNPYRLICDQLPIPAAKAKSSKQKGKFRSTSKKSKTKTLDLKDEPTVKNTEQKKELSKPKKVDASLPKQAESSNSKIQRKNSIEELNISMETQGLNDKMGASPEFEFGCVIESKWKQKSTKINETFSRIEPIVPHSKTEENSSVISEEFRDLIVQEIVMSPISE